MLICSALLSLSLALSFVHLVLLDRRPLVSSRALRLLLWRGLLAGRAAFCLTLLAILLSLLDYDHLLTLLFLLLLNGALLI